MPWDNTPEKRARDAKVYGDPEYKRNKAIVRQRSGGRCEVTVDGRPCGSTDRVQCDHTIPVSQGGTHHLSNLRDACKPCHDRKTAGEGRGYRNGGNGQRRNSRASTDPAPTSRIVWE